MKVLEAFKMGICPLMIAWAFHAQERVVFAIVGVGVIVTRIKICSRGEMIEIHSRV